MEFVILAVIVVVVRHYIRKLFGCKYQYEILQDILDGKDEG